MAIYFYAAHVSAFRAPPYMSPQYGRLNSGFQKLNFQNFLKV